MALQSSEVFSFPLNDITSGGWTQIEAPTWQSWREEDVKYPIFHHHLQLSLSSLRAPMKCIILSLEHLPVSVVKYLPCLKRVKTQFIITRSLRARIRRCCIVRQINEKSNMSCQQADVSLCGWLTNQKVLWKLHWSRHTIIFYYLYLSSLAGCIFELSLNLVQKYKYED